MFYLFVIHSKIKQPSTSIESRDQMAAKVFLFDREQFSLIRLLWAKKDCKTIYLIVFFTFSKYENTTYYAKHTK